MDDTKVTAAPTPRERLAAPPEPEEATEISEPTMQPYQVGWWDGYPNFGCPFCLYRTLEGTRAVEAHIRHELSSGRAEVILQHSQAKE
jgi:hypothetical protein